MSDDEQKTPADAESAGDTPTAEQETVEQPAPAPAAQEATAESAGAAQPTEQNKLFTTPRTRNILLTSGAGLALAGGVIGFGIGHASADGGDGARFDRTSQSVPGEGQPDFRDGNRPDRRPGGLDDGDQPGYGHDDQRSNGDDDPT